VRISVVLGLALVACNGSGGPLVPTIPDAAMMDTYDAWLLGSTPSSAPTFAEVAEPRDDAPKRFRAWLGWSLPRCPECPDDNNMNCAPCEPPFPYVCSRPGRVVRCAGDDLLSMTVSNADDPVPASGVYVFEGRWQPASAAAPDGSFEVTKVMPILAPPDAGAPGAPDAP
jgi:hypothetical protein